MAAVRKALGSSIAAHRSEHATVRPMLPPVGRWGSSTTAGHQLERRALQFIDVADMVAGEHQQDARQSKSSAFSRRLAQDWSNAAKSIAKVSGE